MGRKPQNKVSKRGRVNEGRPTKYLPEYCEQLISYCENGGTFEGFAGKIRVSKDSIYEWASRHPEFSDAKRIADMVGYHWHEKIGVNAILGKIPKFNEKVWTLMGKHRHGMRERLSVTTEDEQGKQMPLQSVSPADLLASWDKLQAIKAGKKK